MYPKSSSGYIKICCILLALAVLAGALLYKVRTRKGAAEEDELIHRTFEGTVKSFDNDGIVISPYWNADKEIAFCYSTQTAYIDENLEAGASVIIEAEYPADTIPPYPAISVEIKPE